MTEEIFDIISLAEEWFKKGLYLSCRYDKYGPTQNQYKCILTTLNGSSKMRGTLNAPTQREAIQYVIYRTSNCLGKYFTIHSDHVLNKVHYLDGKYNIPFIVDSIRMLREKYNIHIWAHLQYVYWTSEGLIKYKAYLFYWTHDKKPQDEATNLYDSPWEALLKILQIANRIYKSKRPLTVNERGFLSDMII